MIYHQNGNVFDIKLKLSHMKPSQNVFKIMKKVFLCFAVLLFLAINPTLAQTPDKPNALAFKRLFIDYETPASGRLELANFRGGWEVAYMRNVNQNLNIGIPFHLGLIKFPEDNFNRTIAGLDGIVQYQFYEPTRFLIPYVFGGVGGVMEDFENLNIQFPVGLGANFRIYRGAFINLQAEYRKSLSEDKDNIKVGLGFLFNLGNWGEDALPPEDQLPYAGIVDADGDGVPDSDDKCPDAAGVAALLGCPDADGDNIADSDDMCPEEEGSPLTKGCPDTDGDGIADSDDPCPESAGPRITNGCPDTDGDGVADKDDKCPSQIGAIADGGCPSTKTNTSTTTTGGTITNPTGTTVIGQPSGSSDDSDGDGFANNIDECPNESGTVRGCPDSDGDGVANRFDPCPNSSGGANGCPDSDGDGVDDSTDRCPNSWGPTSNYGCPGIRAETRAVLNLALQNVNFETGRAQLTSGSYQYLDEIINVMNEYSSYSLSINGHTDNVGDDEKNYKLSEERAKACRDYLNSKGVSMDRMVYAGFGEEDPRADNSSRQGRRINRRVEFNLFIR